MKLILASASPRRRELFEMAGLDFEVRVSLADEDICCSDAGELVKALALKKAEAVKKDAPGCCVVGSDTVVELNGEIIGKPRDAADAYRILSSLSGNTHTVYTGLAVLTDDSAQLCCDTTRVTFCRLSDADIRAYIATGEPLDKAGAYGIQGPAGVFVEKIEGCYFTVIGLPLPRLFTMLRNVGILPRWYK